MSLAVVIVTKDEEANLARTLESVRFASVAPNEIIVVDSGSTDRTVEIARSFGAKVFVEEWKGYAAQKNSAIEKATGDWILALDADEVLEPALAEEIRQELAFQQHADEYRAGDDAVKAKVLALETADGPKPNDPYREFEGNVELALKKPTAAYRIPFKHHFLGEFLR